VEDVKKIARLSRLRVEDTELQSLADDLSGILGWIEQLNEVDVDKRDQILKNAPKKDDGFFVVPRSVE